MAVSPALVWDQLPSAGQVRTSKNNKISKKEDTTVVSRVAPHTSSATETDVATGLTRRAGNHSRSVGGGLRVLDALVELGGAHKGG